MRWITTTLAIASVSLMLGCASNNVNQNAQTGQASVVDVELYTPPSSEPELILRDRQRRAMEAIVNEQKAYDDSLLSIYNVMAKENLQYHICLEVSDDKKECDQMLAKFCQTDQLIDTRSGHHDKPYCKVVKSQGNSTTH